MHCGVKGFLGIPDSLELLIVCWLFSEVGANSSESSFQGGTNIKKGDKRGAQAVRGAREATGAAKASKNGDKIEKKERKNDEFGR